MNINRYLPELNKSGVSMLCLKKWFDDPQNFMGFIAFGFSLLSIVKIAHRIGNSNRIQTFVVVMCLKDTEI